MRPLVEEEDEKGSTPESRRWVGGMGRRGTHVMHDPSRIAVREGGGGGGGRLGGCGLLRSLFM